MQDYSVAGWVLVVTVCPPAAGLDMDFYISFDYLLSGKNNRIQEIRPPAVVDSARIYYSDGLSFFGNQVSSVTELILPDFNNKALREISCQTLPPNLCRCSMG